MKKKYIFNLSLLFILIALLVCIFGKYSYYLKEPINLKDIIYSKNITYIQSDYLDDAQYGIYAVDMNNTVLEKIYVSIFKEGINNYENKNTYILVIDYKTNKVEKKLYWDKQKFGTIKSAIKDKKGNIYVLANKQSNDLSQILEENIICYVNNSPKVIYSVKHDDFVNDVNKTIYNIDVINDKLTWSECQNDILNIKSYDNDQIATILNTKITNSSIKKLNNIVIMDSYIYATFSDNRLYKLSFNNLEFELIKNFNEDENSLYKIYKLNDDQLILDLHEKFGEKLAVYDGIKFETINLNGLPISIYLNHRFTPQVDSFNLGFDYFKLFIYIVYIAIIFLFIYTIRYFYVHIINKKIYITFKLILCILPIILIGNYYIATYTAINNYKMVEQELFLGKIESFNSYFKSKKMKIKEKYGTPTYLGDLLNNIKPYTDINESTMDELYNIMNYSFTVDNFDTQGWYWSVDIISENCMYKIIDSELNDTVFFSRYAYGENSVADSVIKGETYSTLDFNDKYIFSLYPVSDSQGNIVGMVQIGTYYYGFKNQLYDDFFTENSRRIYIMTDILILVIMLITIKSLLPLIKLTKKIETINNSKDKKLLEINEVKSNDEIQVLTHAFNTMTKNINQNMQNMIELNNSYYRFVPLELINLLGKSDIKDVNLGDNVEKNITILCVGINNFYEVMINNKTEKIFNSMSKIYEYIGPIIRENGGIIERFIDKGLVAMFPSSVNGAVVAAKQIVKGVRQLNRESNKFGGINLSCSIDVGEVTFGIIGEEKRLQNTAISYTTNYATVIQENSTKLSSNIIITKSAYEKLDKSNLEYSRFLGKIRFGVLDKDIELYDIYESDSNSTIIMKNLNKAEFEGAINRFIVGDLNEARNGFVKVLDRNIEEEIARIYFYQIDMKINKNDGEKSFILEI